MDPILAQLLAYSIFISYFGLIIFSVIFVGKSILHDVKPSRLLEGRPFLFLRVAVAALGCTWYYMIEFMRWSYRTYARAHPGRATMGHWLDETALFEQAWRIVTKDAVGWWWSSYICTWTVLLTAVIWIESARRGIRYPWAYMLLGQIVAISVSTSLFLAALFVHPRRYSLKSSLLLPLILPMGIAFFTIVYVPTSLAKDQFMPNLLAMHLALLVPLFFSPAVEPEEQSTTPQAFKSLAFPFLLVAGTIHRINTSDLLKSLRPGQSVVPMLYAKITSHPAQASISFDVIWVCITVALWSLVSGSTVSMILKGVSVVTLAVLGVISYTGVNWSLMFSVLPIVVLALFGFGMMYLSKLRSRNAQRRKKLLAGMGIEENVVVPGTTKEPPKKVGSRTIIGFWHPYCNAGGGGERVLWTAIKHLQQVHPGVVVLVYSGDFPKASSTEILAKVNDRFLIKLDPTFLSFIPLPSRHLVDGSYWTHFTLLGQSLGSVYLAWQGLCGSDGMWGDIFLDSMGYSFTWPLVRLICGSEMAIGAYVHYPTVSSDMVRRVRERSFGVENAGAAGSWLKTQVKLVYYRILTSLYAISLLYSEYTMTNSSWTSSHIKSLVTSARHGWLSSLLLMDEKTLQKRGDTSADRGGIVYPPCDTRALVGLGKLDKRRNEIISLAQFRPEKDHAKQLYALAKLFEDHPEYRNGDGRVTLTMAGGARDPVDEARVDGLRALAIKLGVESNVTFLINAPYAEIVQRLGQASIGLNTMQDEHFGINVVEFMAAGLIPVVHASAGPLMDIVVPYKGQKTGFHAKTSEEFAEVIHSALSLSSSEQGKMRRAARSAAEARFSEKVFNDGFDRGYIELRRLHQIRQAGAGGGGGAGM